MRRVKIPRTKITTAPAIISEEVEPVCQYLVGRWYAKCEAARNVGNDCDLLDACSNFWMGLAGLRKISAACSEAVHFSLALSNTTIKAAAYIEVLTGINPMEAWKW